VINMNDKDLRDLILVGIGVIGLLAFLKYRSKRIPDIWKVGVPIAD